MSLQCHPVEGHELYTYGCVFPYNLGSMFAGGVMLLLLLLLVLA